MTEAERLSKIVQAQEKELRRLRKLLGTARVAQAEYFVEDSHLHVVVTAIGIDEYYFTEQCRPELEKIAKAIFENAGAKVDIDFKEVEDMATGLPAEGAVIPE